jgi:release factor glutamine methyltransferase
MTVQESYMALKVQLQKLYEDREAASIAEMVIEKITGYTNTDRILHKAQMFNMEQQEQWNEISTQLLTHKPIQYILQEAWFGGMKFFVDDSVLIPRPETEELVDWLMNEVQSKKNIQQILDVGSGSGCIPIYLKKKNEALQITSIDISEKALSVASGNAKNLSATINFCCIDFLNEQLWNDLPQFDLIVSNPPYIKQSESTSMHNNVLDFEPHLALFVPDDHALIFYEKLANFGRTHLSPEGKIFVEINEGAGAAVSELFTAKNYSAELKKDMNGKDRMLKATLQAG